MDFMDKALSEISNRYGERLDTIIFDGKIHRKGDKQHLWYSAHEWNWKGRECKSVTFGSWRDGQQYTVNNLSFEERNDKDYKKSFNKHTLETRVKLDSEKAEKQKECKEKYYPIWKAAKTGDHEYLSHKGILAFNSRVDLGGERLLIPVYDIDGFVGVQKIFKVSEKFEKKFSYGIKISASICPLKPFKNSEYVYVSEGFATAATIQMAFPDIPSICVFSANNIPKAISTIRAINPNCKIVIAADKDISKAGEKAAKEAIKLHANTLFVLPDFPEENTAWTDFNDLHSFHSLQAVKDQLEIDPSDFTKVTPLGYMGSTYYYTSSSNNQIISLQSGAHSKINFFQLAPIDFWRKQYGIVDSEGETVISYDNIASQLMDACRTKGLFNPELVRGRGVWKDGDHYVINDGEEVLPQPKNSKYHYQKNIKYNLSLTHPLSDDEMIEFSKLFTHIRFKNPKDYIYLMAWVVQAQIFSVLPWRFHLWLTGGRGTGKSTILKWIHSLTITGLLTNNSTSAGVKQELGNDARVTIIDELEPDSGRTEPIIELARQMSTNGGFKTLRGTTHGTSVVTNTQTCFLFGSIQVANLQAADKSRIMTVDLKSVEGQTVEELRAMEEVVDYYVSIKTRLFTRCFNLIPVILSNQTTIQAYLKSHKHLESRLADQLSVVIACYFSFLSTEKIGHPDIENIIETYEMLKGSYIEANSESDSDSCFDEIMQVQIDREGRTVRHAIDKLKDSVVDLTDLVRDLGTHGIRFFKKENEVFISHNSTALSSKLKKFPDYKALLKRDAARFIKIDVQKVESIGIVRGIRLKGL